MLRHWLLILLFTIGRWLVIDIRSLEIYVVDAHDFEFVLLAGGLVLDGVHQRSNQILRFFLDRGLSFSFEGFFHLKLLFELGKSLGLSLSGDLGLGSSVAAGLRLQLQFRLSLGFNL